MSKKIFVLLFVAVFLIASIGFISAEDSADDAVGSSDNLKNITVKKIWDDKGFESQRPDSVQVELYVGGKLVDRINLNSSDNWKAIFKNVDVSGEVKVVELNRSSDYKISYDGNVEDGFVITSKIAKNATKDDVLGKSNDSDKLADNNTSQKQNTTENNNTKVQNASADDNKTENITIYNITNETDIEINNTTTIKNVNKTVNKTVVVNEEKAPPKKPPANLIDLRNTGLPILFLVIVVIGAVFFSLRRKK